MRRNVHVRLWCAAAVLILQGAASGLSGASLQLNALAQPEPDRVQRVSDWGGQIRRALDSNALTALEVHGFAVKDNPSRVVDVRQYLRTGAQVRSILEPAAGVLERREFRLADMHNLAVLSVSFKMDLPSICPDVSTQFAITSTTRDYLYVGCVARDAQRRDVENWVRIWSPALDQALRSSFPRELL